MLARLLLLCAVVRWAAGNCPSLTLPNGSQTQGCTDGVNLVSSCVQTCNPGYYGNGCDGTTRTCPLLSNTWSGCDATCTGSKCPVASVSGQQTVGTCTANGNLGAMCNLGCATGYAPVPGTWTAGTCSAVGTTSAAAWQGQVADCQPIKCGAPSLTTGQTQNTLFSNSPLGTTGQLGCATGYVPSGATTGTCTQSGYNGVWVGASITCTASPCVSYGAPGNGSVSGSCVAPVSQGQTCTPACNPGFVLTGATVTCNPGPGTAASWSAGAASCTASLCQLPALPTNGTYASCPVNVNMGINCTVGCANGWVPTAGAQLTRSCQAVGLTSAVSYGTFAYACFLCPGGAGNACFGHGNCSQTFSNATCTCNNGWGSANCSTLLCPGDLVAGPCSGNGTCNEVAHTCACRSGFFGDACAVRAPVIARAFPLLAPVTGNGAAIDLYGTGFATAHTGAIYCVFTNTTSGRSANSTILFYNATLATCVPPPAVSGDGTYTLTVTAPGTTLLTTAFRYYLVPEIISRAPAGGVYTGGTKVFMTVDNFLNISSAAVVFDSPARYATSLRVYSAEVLYATSPSVTLQSGTNGKAVSIGVTYNGRDIHYANSSFIYFYHIAPTITFFTPSSLPGGQNTSTLIYVVGPYFFLDNTYPLLYCKMTNALGNATYIAATYISSAVVTCLFPPNAAQMVQVQMTSNLQEYSAPRAFLYYGVPSKLLVNSGWANTTDNVNGRALGITVSLVDNSNVLADPDSSYVLQANISPDPVASTGLFATSVQAVASFAPLQFTGCPNVTYTIIFSLLTSTSFTVANSQPIRIRVLTCGEALPGSVLDTATNYTCACPPGTYWGTLLGASGPSCIQCPMGTARNIPSTGPSVCTSCNPGSFSNVTGKINCDACDPGTFAVLPGRDVCTPCAQGAYSASGASICSLCNSGTVSPGGSSSCTSCDAGYYASPLGFPCLACGNGMVSPPSSVASGCTSCPAGYFSNTPTATCTACANGTYSDMRASGCINCLPGTYTPQAGMGVCLRCSPGTISGERAAVCTACPPGSVADVLNLFCAPCQPGYTNTGTFCVPCSVGTYMNVTTQQCENCPAGYDSPQAAIACVPCTQGNYAPVNGTPQCLPCGAGATSTPDGTGCVDCKAGEYSEFGSPSCEPCGVGFYSNTTAAAQCEPCAPGSYNDAQGATACKLCTAGSFSSTGRASACVPCYDGFVAPNPGSTSCGRCGDGSYARAGVSCPCLSGYGYIECSQTCLLCPEGAYCPGDFQAPVTRPGFYRRVDNNFTECKENYAEKLTDEYLRCFPAEACLGGIVSGCADGFTGDRCATCAFRADTDVLYYRSYGKCSVCPPFSGFVVWALILIAILLICFLILGSSPRLEGEREGGQPAHGDEDTRGSPIDVLSIVVAAYQVCSLIGSVGLNWTVGANQMFTFMTVFSLNADGLPGCAVKMAPQYITMYKLVLPVIALFFLFVIYWVNAILSERYKESDMRRIARCTRFLRPRDRFVGAFITILDVFYTTLASTALNAYNCVRIEDGSYVNEVHPEILCYTPQWREYLIPGSATGIVVYVVGYPLILVSILIYHRKHLDQTKILMRYGSLYAAFHPKYFWWTLTDKGNKLLVAIVVSVISANIYVRITAASMILVMHAAVSVYAHPYRQTVITYVSIYGSLLAVCCGLLGLASQGTDGISGLLATILIVGMAGLYTCYSITAAVQLLRRKLTAQRAWQNLRANLGTVLAQSTSRVEYINEEGGDEPPAYSNAAGNGAGNGNGKGTKYLQRSQSAGDSTISLTSVANNPAHGAVRRSRSNNGMSNSKGNNDGGASTAFMSYDSSELGDMDIVPDLPPSRARSGAVTPQGSPSAGTIGGSRAGLSQLEAILEQSITSHPVERNASIVHLESFSNHPGAVHRTPLVGNAPLPASATLAMPTSQSVSPMPTGGSGASRSLPTSGYSTPALSRGNSIPLDIIAPPTNASPSNGRPPLRPAAIAPTHATSLAAAGRTTSSPLDNKPKNGVDAASTGLRNSRSSAVLNNTPSILGGGTIGNSTLQMPATSQTPPVRRTVAAQQENPRDRRRSAPNSGTWDATAMAAKSSPAGTGGLRRGPSNDSLSVDFGTDTDDETPAKPSQGMRISRSSANLQAAAQNQSPYSGIDTSGFTTPTSTFSPPVRRTGANTSVSPTSGGGGTLGGGATGASGTSLALQRGWRGNTLTDMTLDDSPASAAREWNATRRTPPG